MDAYDVLLGLVCVGAALGVLQMMFDFWAWRAREARETKAFAVMQAMYKKARRNPLRSRRQSAP